jgi:hypothetical protein
MVQPFDKQYSVSEYCSYKLALESKLLAHFDRQSILSPFK